MYKLILVIFIILINHNSCLRITNFFRKRNCYSRISINQNNIYSDKEILKKNDKFYIYIDGEKSLKAKVIKEYIFNKDIQNNYIEFNNTDNDNLENVIECNDNIENVIECNDNIENVIECNDNIENNSLENEIEKEYKNKIINVPENILSLFVFLFLYLSMNSYMLGLQLRKKIYNIMNK